MSDGNYSVDIRSGHRNIVSVDRFSIPQERITFLFGESGIGKSMISKAVYGLLDPDEIDVRVNAGPYSEHLDNVWTKQVQANSFFVFQEPSSHLNPLMKISEQLNEGTLRYCEREKEILNRLLQTEVFTMLGHLLR